MLTPNSSNWAIALIEDIEDTGTGILNHERVRSYVEKHPRCSVKELARALDMRVQTAGRHLTAVLKEMEQWS